MDVMDHFLKAMSRTVLAESIRKETVLNFGTCDVLNEAFREICTPLLERLRKDQSPRRMSV